MLSITDGDKKRFWEKVDKTGECWEWMAAKDYGYGRFHYNGKLYRAHRFSWEIENKRKIPKGMYICHSCDNRSCVNPEHLFLGTHSDNVKDSYNKGGQTQRGANNANSKLTYKEVLMIKKAYNVSITKREFSNYWGNKFGVSSSAIIAVLNGYSWTHVSVGKNDITN